MKQTSVNVSLNVKKTRRRKWLEQMDQVVPCAALAALIAPFPLEGRNGRPPIPLLTTLRIHVLQRWCTMHDRGMEEAFFNTPLYREFAQPDAFARQPDESTILRFRHRLEKHKLAEQILTSVNALLAQRGLLLTATTHVNATLIAAPPSTKNKDKARGPEMHSSTNGNQCYFGMKAHIGAHAEYGLVHTVCGTAGRVSDIAEGNALLHVQETVAFGDAGYQGVEKRPDAKPAVTGHVAMRPGKPKALDRENEADVLIDQAEQLKADIRAKVEHFLRVFKRLFGFVKVRYRGLKKKTYQLFALFALSNLWMMRSKLMGVVA